MINKISRLKNFSVFRNFTWDSKIPEFKRFNLIYGWNRSGKTVLSRIFSACEKQTTGFDSYPEDGEFQLEHSTNSSINQTNITSQQLSIKVFNSDFIKENLFFDQQDKHCNPIVYISEEDIDSKNKLALLKKDQKQLDNEFQSSVKNKFDKEKAEINFRISTAQTISSLLTDKSTHDYYYSYERDKVKKRIDEVGIDKFQELPETQVKEYKKQVNSEAKKKLNTFPKHSVNFPFQDSLISSFDEIFNTLQSILSKKIISERIQRLKDNQEVNIWVKQGFDLHNAKGETKKCLFCQNQLSDNLLDSLSKHFSDDYSQLQNDIDTLIEKLTEIKKVKMTESVDLYSDLITDYQSSIINFNQLIDELENWLNEIIKKLQLKRNNPFDDVESGEKPQDYQAKYNKIVDDLNEIIKKHNTKVDNHAQEVKEAKKKLEHHLISEAIKKQDYQKIKENFDSSVNNEKECRAKLKENQKAIQKLEQATSNIGRAIQKINKYLEEFFGRKEIQLELDHSKKGYLIKRDEQVAQNLSEGEKTALAFSYFITKVQEKDFKVKDGIIFIDDPISSFDSNFIYHCFSVIKSHFKGSGQLFISTHNFELLNLVKDWFCKKNSKARKKNKDEICEFYMIENTVESNKRCAYLVALEETLKNFKSEYHYLFFLLNRFIEKDVPEYADYYTIGNIARRFLEIFTNFKIPTTGDLASKIGELEIDTTKISRVEQDKVYKLIQEFSHGTDPASTIEHKDKSESKEAMKILLKIIEESDSKHYDLLRKNLPPEVRS